MKVRAVFIFELMPVGRASPRAGVESALCADFFEPQTRRYSSFKQH
jgi:hypothetical protein